MKFNKTVIVSRLSDRAIPAKEWFCLSIKGIRHQYTTNLGGNR